MTTLHVEAIFNPEEAAHAAAEFVSSLDNLPGEVAFLLEEIRDRDDRINDLLDRIDTRHLSLTQKARSAMAKAEAAAASSPAAASASHPYPLPLAAGSTIPTSHLSNREEQAIKKVIGEFEKVQALQDEKVELAERMERIVLRAKERGRAEWIRVGGKDIAEVESEEMAAMNTGGRASKGGTPGLGAGEGGLGVPSAGLGGERPQKRKKPNLSLAASMPPPPAPVRHPPLGTSNSFLTSAHNTPLSSSHGAGASSGRKRERGERERESRSVAASDADADGESEDYINFQHAGSNVGSGANVAEGAYGVTGPMPAFGFAGSGSGYAGQAARGPKGYTVTHPPPEDIDMDAEGEMDGDMEADDRPYCICQQRSYGEMVGCDNEECPYEWFHIKCLNMTGAPSGTWYCPDCTKLLGIGSRGGREKADKPKKGRKSRG